MLIAKYPETPKRLLGGAVTRPRYGNFSLAGTIVVGPILASRVGDLRELIREGETGWTAQKAHADEWISRIR